MKFLCNCSTFIQKSLGNSYFTLVKQFTDLFTENLCQIAGLLSWTFTQIFFIAVTRMWCKIKWNSIEWVPTKSRKTNSILHPADEIWTNSSFLWMKDSFTLGFTTGCHYLWNTNLQILLPSCVCGLWCNTQGSTKNRSILIKSHSILVQPLFSYWLMLAIIFMQNYHAWDDSFQWRNTVKTQIFAVPGITSSKFRWGGLKQISSNKDTW